MARILVLLTAALATIAAAAAAAFGSPALSRSVRRGSPSVASQARLPRGYRKLTTITGPKIPNGPFWAGDLGWVAPREHRFYFSDTANAQVDVFDTRTDSYVGAVAEFTGIAPGIPTNAEIAVSGPTGVGTVDGEVWAGDGNSTLKVINPTTLKVVATISTGGKKRADEFAWDPEDNVVLVGNPSDKPVFATLISVSSRQILARITLPTASGIEQPVWDPAQHRFFVGVPLSKGGEILGISPTSERIVKIYRLPRCAPNGMAVGPGQQAVLGCNQPAEIINLRNGHVVATLPKLKNTDQVAYDPHAGVYLLASNGFSANASLGVVDAKSHRLIANPKTSLLTHSLGVDPATDRVFVPENSGIAVFAPRF